MDNNGSDSISSYKDALAIQTPGLDEAMNIMGINSNMITSESPMGYIGIPEDISNAVTWLCSPDAGFMSGHVYVMVIHGGEMA